MPIVQPTINELMEKVDCRYTLVVEASAPASWWTVPSP